MIKEGKSLYNGRSRDNVDSIIRFIKKLENDGYKYDGPVMHFIDGSDIPPGPTACCSLALFSKLSIYWRPDKKTFRFSSYNDTKPLK